MSVHTHAETYKVIHPTVKDVNIMQLSDGLIPRLFSDVDRKVRPKTQPTCNSPNVALKVVGGRTCQSGRVNVGKERVKVIQKNLVKSWGKRWELRSKSI